MNVRFIPHRQYCLPDNGPHRADYVLHLVVVADAFTAHVRWPPVGEERRPLVSVYEQTVLLTRTVDSLVRVTRRAVDTGHDDQSQSGNASDRQAADDWKLSQGG